MRSPKPVSQGATLPAKPSWVTSPRAAAVGALLIVVLAGLPQAGDRKPGDRSSVARTQTVCLLPKEDGSRPSLDEVFARYALDRDLMEATRRANSGEGPLIDTAVALSSECFQLALTPDPD